MLDNLVMERSVKTCFKILPGAVGAAIMFGFFAAITVPAIAADVQYADEELRSLAFAVASIRLIEGTERRQLLEISNEAEATAIQAQSETQKAAILEQAGFTSDQYEEMSERVSADAEMNATFQRYVLAEMGIVHSEEGEWERTLVRSGMATE
jgi:hypothetical protein